MTRAIQDKKDLDKLKNLYVKGYSTKEIGQKFSLSPSCIRDYLNRLRFKLKRELKNYKINENFFNKVNTSEKAYWLGFLYADGYVNEKHFYIRLNLADKDINHIRKFKKSIKSSHPIKYVILPERRIENGKLILSAKQPRVSIYNKKIVIALKKLGCRQGKSLNLVFPTRKQVPDKFLSHFIRGYFDGDGSTWINPKGQKFIGLSGTKRFLESVSKIFEKKLSITKSSVYKNKRGNKISYFCIGGNIKTNKISDFLYKNSNKNIEMERKSKILKRKTKFMNKTMKVGND